MTKKLYLPNSKIVLDNGYLTHLTIKWKDVTKNEKAIITVMGMVYEGEISIPVTLQLLGHNEEVLKEKTENVILKGNGCSAIQRFDVKSVMGNLKEEEVSEITAKIELNAQTLRIPFHKNRLRIATTCKERWHEAITQNAAKKHSSEKDSYFNWVSNGYTLSKVQTQDGVQNKFNYSKDDSPYVVDPEVFEMEEAIDIGKQINDSMIGGGGMNKVYVDALKQKGKPMSFKWIDEEEEEDKIRRHAFNSNWIDQKMSKAMPFGAVSAKITKGKITVCDDGSYFVEGVLVYDSDLYSWNMDSPKDDIEGVVHNAAIWVGGQNINYDENHKNRRRWHESSEAYKKGKDPMKDTTYGQMPVNYAKDYHFYIFGIKK
jgi:hypothetical protein